MVMDIFERTQNNLTGQYLLPHILVWTSQVTSDHNNYLSLVYDGEDELTEDIFTRIYQAYYNYLTDSGLNPKSSSNREKRMYIMNFYITAGLDFKILNQNDLFDPTLNLVTSYVRHYYTTPTHVYDIPRFIGNDTFGLPTGIVDQVNKLIGKMVHQKSVPKTIRHQFNMIKKGTIETSSLKFHYELEDKNLHIHSVPKDNFKVVGLVSVDVVYPLKIRLTDMTNQPIRLTKDEDWVEEREFLESLKKRLELHKLKFIKNSPCLNYITND